MHCLPVKSVLQRAYLFNGSNNEAALGLDCFPDELKLAEVSPILKNNDDLDKENRPVSILSYVSKVFEKIMYLQIDTFTRDKFSKLLTDFRKNHSTQRCLTSMLEMWKNALGKGGYVSAIFMDLSKVFDTLNHNILIAKLGDYGFERNSLFFMKSYLSDRQQRVLINNHFSSWGKMFAGVLEVSILWSLLFKIFNNDLFLFVSSSYISDYADDNTLYASDFNLKEVKNCSVLILMQSQNGFMKTTWLLMLGSVISCVLEKIQEMKLSTSMV